MKKENFVDYLERKNDRIDNAAHELACAILDKDPIGSDRETVLPWNMEIIGQITDFVTDLLSQRSLPACHPYFGDNDTPCFDCGDCKNADCPFKKGGEKA